MQYLEPITETSYLSAVNAVHYRRIMRVFFREYERVHYNLYKEDVLERLHEEEGYEQYPMEQLKLDLDALVSWKNLNTVQDPGRVYTIADYKNKQYRYSMTAAAVEIERMTIRLENLVVESGNLSTNLFARLAEGLEQAPYLAESKKVEAREISQWWSNLQEDFRRLNQNYQDYLREFYSGKSEKLLKSVEFILHKDRFIAYLREFIQEVQRYSIRIGSILRRNSGVIEQLLLDRVVAGEMDIPRTFSEEAGDREEIIKENVYGKWRTLKGWFLEIDGQASESTRLLSITNDVIRSIIQNAAMIVQMQNWGVSRKDDYLRFLELFSNCDDLEEAHRLSAHVFGVQQIAHFKANAPRETDRINLSVYEEEPMEYELKPHTRSYRQKKERSGFQDRTMEKIAQRRAYLDRIEHERDLALQYIKNGKLDLRELTGVVPEHLRITLLKWITQAAMNSNLMGRTEYGQVYRLHREDGEHVLHCEDGDLVMPAFVLEFTEETR